jgi:citrate synthase
MTIGKTNVARMSICTSDADSITVRGHDLTRDLNGHRSFNEYFFLSVAGKLPTDLQREFLDVLPPLRARSGGLHGHLAEEQQYSIGFLLPGKASESIDHAGYEVTA